MLKRRHYLKFEADPSPRPNPPRYSTHHELPHEAKNPTHSKSLQFKPNYLRNPHEPSTKIKNSIIIGPKVCKEVCLIRYTEMGKPDQYMRYSNIFKLPKQLEKIKKRLEEGIGHAVERPCRRYANLTEINDGHKPKYKDKQKQRHRKLKSFKNIHKAPQTKITNPSPYPQPQQPTPIPQYYSSVQLQSQLQLEPESQMPSNTKLINRKAKFLESKVIKIQGVSRMREFMDTQYKSSKIQDKDDSSEGNGSKLMEKDPLKLTTMYNSDEFRYNHQRILQLLQTLSRPPTKQIYSMPTQSQIPHFIKKFTPLFPQLCIKQLVLSPHFQIQGKFDQPQNPPPFYEQNSRLKVCRFLYFGEKKEGRYHGLGVMVTAVEVREGYWQNGGQVKGTIKSQGEFYRGDMRDGKRHGFGSSRYANGEYYEGYWEKDRRCGHGYFKFSKSQSYLGQWKQGQFEDKGVLKTQLSVYQGNFKQSLRSGSSIQKFTNGDTYKGNFSDNLPSDLGTYTWKKGITYQGNFTKGLRQGHGTLTVPSCVRYVGNFKNDLPSGLGVAYYNNGDEYHGLFYQGERSGQGDLLCREKKVFYTGDWHKNSLVHSLP